MRTQYHIVNGDVLLQQFPESIQGELIVARECLVDGDVTGSNLDELFSSRAQFISNNYDGYSEQDYYDKTVSEFQKIQGITDDADINLWFEDDLFCQVNFWFTLSLLNQFHKNNPTFLIRPKIHTQHGFGGLEKPELVSVYENRLLLTEVDKLSGLWELYQNGSVEQLLQTAQELEYTYPFILTAVKAHAERIPTERNLGRPIQSLCHIIAELETEEFEPVFREFSKRESIYGFGDLQVKRLLDGIKNNR